MNRRVFIGLIAIIALVCFTGASAWSGQVVTDDLKAWAKEAIARESSLRPAADPNTVAVLYFQNKTGERLFDPVKKGLALMLITDLSRVKELRIVERARLQALVEELKLGKSGVVARGSEPEVGRLLGAGFIVGGDLLAGQAVPLKADARTVSVAKADTVDRSMSEGRLEELMRIEKDLLFSIVETLKLELSEAEMDALRQPISKNIKALLSMFKGLARSDRGDYLHAADYYRSALKIDPGLAMADNALKELENLGLAGPKERGGRLLKSIKAKTSLTDQLYEDKVVERERGSGGGASDSTDVRVEW